MAKVSEEISKDIRRPSVINPADDRPKLGEWYWVMCDDWEHPTSWCNGRATGGKGKKQVERLLCVSHIASNHVQFSEASIGGGKDYEYVRNGDLAKLTRRETGWQAIIQLRIADKQDELQKAVHALTDLFTRADLGEATASQSMLPALTRQSPEQTKAALIHLKEKACPAAEKNVEYITKEIVALHTNLCLPMHAQKDALDKKVSMIDRRLFALELYAGIGEQIVTIRKGEPAPAETPIAVRQMLRFMDEETLIDYDTGGMDFKKLDEFDKWVAKDANLNRICPEPRCVVAMQIRRHEKDYGLPTDLCHAIEQINWHNANKWTYLLIRNGSQVYRLFVEIDFRPRLLPFRDEFHKPFTKTERRSNFGRVPFGQTKDWEEIIKITPQDWDYDDHVNKRLTKLYEYNRVMFLIQGLLDRSKVFAPHPPINLGNESDLDRYFKPVFDEELGLPSANPPRWEFYRDTLNAKLAKGKFAWCIEGEENKTYSRDSHRPKRGYNANSRPTICEVYSISKDRKTVEFRWPWGMRWGKEHGDWGRFGEWPVNRMCRQRVPIEKVFNVTDYQRGDYKKFLCDAYLKGAYLTWAPPLLAAERFHHPQDYEKDT